MPPKSSQKPKKEAAPPPQQPKKAPPSKPQPKQSPVKTTPKKPKSQAVTSALKRDARTQVPVDVSYEGESAQARLRKTGDFSHTLKLTAPGSFSLVKSIIIPDGEYEGFQAILIRPAQAFPFLKLPKEARARVYTFYFAAKGVVDAEIVLEAKRKDTKDVYAKTYADGSKERVALLAVNKEVHEEAVPVLYANTFMLENTTMLLDFVGQLLAPVRQRLTSISVKSYVKTTSRSAMQFLGEAGNITRLHIESGVYTEADPVKAAKYFLADASKFLEAVAAVKGDKGAGIDVLSFGKMALTYKDEQKKAKPWDESMVREFKDALREKFEK